MSRCCNLNCNIKPWKSAYSIQNKLQLDIRRFISKYYRGEVECDNRLCLKRTRILNLDSSNCHECNYCSDGTLVKIVSRMKYYESHVIYRFSLFFFRLLQYKESDLFNQLRFFLHIFSLTERHLEGAQLNMKYINNTRLAHIIQLVVSYRVKDACAN